MRRASIISLGVINLLAFCSLFYLSLFAVLYYTDIQVLYLWGLPFMAGSLIILFSGILTSVRRSWRWGVTGIGIILVLYLWFLITLALLDIPHPSL